MVILEKTKTQLKLRHRPYTLWMITGSWMLVIVVLLLLISLQQTWLIYLGWMPLFIVLNIIISSLVLIVAGRVVICHFDKDYNSLTIQKRGLMNTQVSLHPLTDILDIQLRSTSWRQDEKADYQIVIVFKSGRSLSLNIVSNPDISKKLEATNLIREFLRLPPQKLNW
ncbi:MAG TPA: hypothetical protein V6C95_03580 [Coleofasciculaceae cyanobacterium]